MTAPAANTGSHPVWTLGDSSDTTAVRRCVWKKALDRLTRYVQATRSLNCFDALRESLNQTMANARGTRHSVVLVDTLATFVPLLRLDCERRDRTRLQPLERDWLAGLFAIAVSAVLDAGERLVNLGNQLALSVAGPELDRPVSL